MTKTNAQRVRDFHLAVGAAAPDCPAVPDAALLYLRENLIDEEYREVKAAIAALRDVAAGAPAAASVTGLVHELADLLYVAYGAMIACGVDPDAVFAEVHRANMEKTAGPRRADGKQLKPPGWQPADVAAVVDGLCP